MTEDLTQTARYHLELSVNGGAGGRATGELMLETDGLTVEATRASLYASEHDLTEALEAVVAIVPDKLDVGDVGEEALSLETEVDGDAVTAYLTRLEEDQP